MKGNVGTLDRVIRAVVGFALVAWAVMGGPVWAYLGVVPLLSAAVSFCPAYSLLGITTCAADAKA